MLFFYPLFFCFSFYFNLKIPLCLNYIFRITYKKAEKKTIYENHKIV